MIIALWSIPKFIVTELDMLKIIAIVAVVFAIAIAAVLILAAPSRTVSASGAKSTVKAPAEKIFPLINDFHQWVAWSP